MKRLAPLLVYAILLISNEAAAELKAAYINSAIILQQAPQAIQANEDMNREFESRQKLLREKAVRIQSRESVLQKDGASMSTEQKAKIKSEILESKRKLGLETQSLQEDIDVRRKQEIKKMREFISAVIHKYSKKNGYDFVFTEGVAYASDNVNITEEILRELRK